MKLQRNDRNSRTVSRVPNLMQPVSEVYVFGQSTYMIARISHSWNDLNDLLYKNRAVLEPKQQL